MADEAKKMQEQKDDTAGLGTLVGITALAALPFLKPIRSFVRQKLAKETIESQAGTKIPRVIAEEAQVVPQITYTPDKTKVNYMVKQKQPQIEPLLNDRPFESKPMFGSALYDAIKASPADEMLADDWLKFFKSKQNTKYNDGRSSSIQMEELFDTNIANIDAQGNIIGGILGAAKNINAPINKELLLAQVKNNPINKMKLVELKAPENFQQSIDTLEEQIKTTLDTVRKKYPGALSGIQDLEKALQVSQGVRIGNYRTNGSTISDTTVQNLGQTFRDALKKLNTKGIDPQDKSIFENALKTVNAETERLFIAARDPYRLQHNAQEIGQYKLPGELNPKEIVWYYPEKIKTNTVSSSHFSIPETNYGQTQPLVHAMYGTRFTPKGEKVLSINEIQADVQQRVFEQVKDEGKKRINPFNKEAEAGLLVKPRENIQNEINAILKKGMYATEDDTYKLNKLLGEQKLIKKGLSAEKGEGNADFLPMFDTKQYTDYAVKTIARKAAEQGDQWVAVVPQNLIARGKGAIPGNELVYGYGTGKGIAKKGDAIIPDLMRKLANQYKTEAKPIQVSKSDPDRPYKIVEKKTVSRFDKNPEKFSDAKELEKFKVDHHIAAFKNEEDAKIFLNRYADSGAKIQFIPKDSHELYDIMYALRITPDMANKPFKLYKHTGGLIEDIFKAPLI